MDVNYDINTDFGVGEETLSAGGASPPYLSVPQFLYDDVVSAAGGMEVSHEPHTLEVSTTDLARPPARRERTLNAWDPRLIVDLALRLDDFNDILDRYGLDMATYERLSSLPSFRKDLANTIKDLHESGQTFQRTARTQATVYLEQLDDIVNDYSVPAATRLSAIQCAVKWGDLEPKVKKEENQNQNNIQININY
jgi:hypothetical protein